MDDLAMTDALVRKTAEAEQRKILAMVKDSKTTEEAAAKIEALIEASK